jgi:TonB-linked SusC/RagA family outer membrane protein
MKRSSFSTLRVGAVLLALLVGTAGGAWAQNAVIRGTVRSDVGELIEGASVIISELGIQTATGANGQYLISVAAARVRGQSVSLRFRMIGFRPATNTLTLRAGEQVIDVTMQTDVNRLEDIVVTGVMEGTPQTATTFSIGRVNVADLPVPQVNPLAQLAGQVPGVNVTSASGRPGATPDVMMRGPTSINASGRGQQPLYIVDGVILQGGLPDLNSQDIENIEVVKGAAGASLYGARAAAGVINITTKSGRTAAEGLTFRIREESGFSDIEKEFKLARQHSLLMDATGTRFCIADNTQPLCARSLDWISERDRVNNNPGDYALVPRTLAYDPGSGASGNPLRQNFLSRYFPVPTYDPVRQVTTNSPFTNTNLEATGRVGSTQYFASVSQLRQKGSIRGFDGYTRYTARLNVNQRIGSNLSLAFNTYYARGKQDGFAADGGGNLFFRLTRQPAAVNLLARDTLGRLMIRSNIMNQGDQNQNPLLWTTANGFIDQQINERFVGGGTLRWSPFAWIDVEGNFSFDRADYQYNQYYPKGFHTQGVSWTSYNGFLEYNPSGNEAYNASLNVTLRKDLGQLQTRWNFRYLFERQDTYNVDEWGSTLAVVGVDAAINATSGQNIRSSVTSTRLVGLFAGANFTYKERYIADVLLRRDGSSRFGANHRWGTFGRVSLAWRLGQEPFWPWRDAFSEFKLRFSYGTAGNRPSWSAQYETYSIGTGGSLSPGQLGNANLRPEINIEREFGADMELFRRVGVNITYSNSDTKDQILPVPTPAVTGFGSQWQNAGTLNNKTWEFSVNVPVIRRRDLSWSWRFNYDRTRTVVTKLDVPPFNIGATSVQNGGNILMVREGERYGTIYGYYVLRGAEDCAKLPEPWRSDCGTSTSSFQVNNDGFLVWVGQGNTWRDGLTKNLWMTRLPGCRDHTTGAQVNCGGATADTTAPWGVQLNWGTLIAWRDSTGARQNVPLGNALPDWRMSVSQTLQWRRLTLYALLEGVIGRDVWNQGRHWSYLDFMNQNEEQRGADPELAKPIGYYYRSSSPESGSGIGGWYQTLNPYNWMVEDASFAKLRELSLTYRVGPVGGVGNWEVSLIGRNVFTIAHYKGFDPEVGIGGGQSSSATVNAIDAYTFPNLRTFTLALSTSF